MTFTSKLRPEDRSFLTPEAEERVVAEIKESGKTGRKAERVWQQELAFQEGEKVFGDDRNHYIRML